MIGEKGMFSDRNGRAFRAGGVLRRQQGYTEFDGEFFEAYMEGSNWLGSSDFFHEATRKTEVLYPKAIIFFDIYFLLFKNFSKSFIQNTFISPFAIHH